MTDADQKAGEATSSPVLDRYQNLIFIALAGAILVGALVLVAGRPAPPSIVINPPAPTMTPGPIRVYVSGAVMRPDVYTLPWGAIAKDAVEAAGGMLETGDAARVNLAQRLQDGEHIHVPSMNEAAALPADDGSPARVPVNSANRETLETLPGIGPSLAQRIIDHRDAHGPFTTPEQLTDVPGIGPVTLENIRDLIILD